MFDALFRRHMDAPLDRAAALVARTGLSANAATGLGFAIGLAAAFAIALGALWLGFALIIVSRLFDGLDGALARRLGPTDLGGFLDITLDFIFYASIPLAFAIHDPAANALAAAFLLCGFMGSASTFLAFAIFAQKHGLSTEARGRKSLYYLGGLTEGTETILCLLAMCVFPAYFPVFALIYGVMCWITAGTRIATAMDMLKGRV